MLKEEKSIINGGPVFVGARVKWQKEDGTEHHLNTLCVGELSSAKSFLERELQNLSVQSTSLLQKNGLVMGEENPANYMDEDDAQAYSLTTENMELFTKALKSVKYALKRVSEEGIFYSDL